MATGHPSAKASVFLAAGLLAAAMGGIWLHQACGGDVIGGGGDGGGPPPPACTGGADKDGDGYGPGCPAGTDCNDDDPGVHPGAQELCDGKDNNCDGQVDEGMVKNACGTCDPGCAQVGGGGTPFPTDPSKDPNLKESNGVKQNPSGDLTLDSSMVQYNYLWIANTYDTVKTGCNQATPPSPELCRGTISKVDTAALKEVARYYTLHCASSSGPTGCVDVNGVALTRDHNHTPSRTAVDFNFDVWVANRSVHGGQPSATKIANDPSECVERNGVPGIQTSKDQDGNGKIDVDCDHDGKPDTLATHCANGLPPEFLGDDDECILFTTAYADLGDVGRSICLDPGKSMIGASNAWVGTFYRPENGRGNNRFYMINGTTGKIEATVDLPPGHHTYGCMADSNHIIWSTDIGMSASMLGSPPAYPPWRGSLTYFSALPPHEGGQVLRGPTRDNPWTDKKGWYHHYGIVVDGNGYVWLGGYASEWVLRYKPDRTSVASLANGTWTRIDMPDGFITRGIAADMRGKVWVAIQNGGHILRIDQSIPEGVQNLTQTKDYWRLTANEVIGVGVDFNGHVWGVGKSNDVASRLDVDGTGNVVQPPTGQTKNVPIGKSPYTYSDFTGYGLMNFVRPQGRWTYQHKACPEGVKATWTGVSWKATTPASTQVVVRVRTGDSDTTFGAWSKEFTSSPAAFGPKSAAAVSPNPATYLQVEFTLQNQGQGPAPVLEEYGVSYVCNNVPT
jgi:hypothetical protein